MTHALTPADGMSAQRPFLAVVWAALLTALLSALLPVGLPHSTTVGSAFNPATTSVALRAGTHRPLIASDSIATAKEDKGSGGFAPHTVIPLLPVPDAGLPPGITAVPLPPDTSAVSPLSGRLFSAAYPRGPPLG